MSKLLLLSENKFKKLKALHVKKYRERDGAFLTEGVRLCEDAVASNAAIQAVIVTEKGRNLPRVQRLLNEIKAETFLATTQQMQQLCDTETPQGICLVVKFPEMKEQNYSDVVLVLDALQDPGNIGTIFRTADWFGIKTIFLGKGSVDAYNPKVVRSSMGSIFRLNLYQDVETTLQCETLSAQGYHIAAAVMDGNTQISKLKIQKTALVIGNEANGIQTDVLRRADSLVFIPGQGQGESLNAAVAASLFIYQLTPHE